MGSQLGMGTRAVVSLVYLALLAVGLSIFDHGLSFLWTNGPRGFLFVATAVALVFGNYILEPFFSKPADVLVNTVGLMLALLGFAPAKQTPIAGVVVGVLALLALLALALMLISPRWHGKSRDIVYALVTRLGRSRVLFSLLYVYAVIAYFDRATVEFWVLLAYLLAVVFVEPLERLVLVLRDRALGRSDPDAVARIVERTGAATFFLESTTKSEAPLPATLGLRGSGSKLLLVATVSTNEAPKLRRSRVQAFSVEGKMIYLDQRRNTLELIGGPFRPLGDAIEIEWDPGWVVSDDLKAAGIDKKLEKPVGFVSPGSNSERILVDLLEGSDALIAWAEGTVLECRIQGEDCNLQITAVEAVQGPEQASYREVFWRASCQKLGAIEGGRAGFKVISWIPLVGETVFAVDRSGHASVTHEIALSVGRVPGLEHPVDVTSLDKLVTHNAAFLGALGTGKTMLATRLASDLVVAGQLRVISIDVTEQHVSLFASRLGAGLVGELDAVIGRDLSVKASFIQTRTNPGSNQSVQDPNGSGNIDDFRVNVRRALCLFLFTSGAPGPTIDGDRRVLVINPDHFDVTKGERMGFQVVCVSLSAAEKAQVISEILLSILIAMGLTPAGAARVLLVLEEAHTLVPEFSFVAQDGDKAAANATARVVLQGRKYGLGAFVIAQRTANVSKSILSQCSTVFALRMFDDTGRAFLSNFIGDTHANGLSQLPDQHAVVVGAGLGNEQSVIVRLPELT